MNFKMVLRVAAASAGLALSAHGHASTPSAAPACQKLVPKGEALAVAPVDAAVERVRASALFTSPRLAVVVLRTDQGVSTDGARHLAFSESGVASKVFAEFRNIGPSRSRLEFRVPPRDGNQASDLRRLAVFEHLYAFVLREPPLTVYDVRAIGGDSEVQALSHPELLGRLARMRNCAATEVASGGARVAIRTWEMPVIDKPVSTGPDLVNVSARVSYPTTNGYGGQITVARGACLTCSTQVGRDGAAACTLFDSHGHSNPAEHASEATVLSFSGVVERTRIVLPVTHIQESRVPSFGRRIF